MALANLITYDYSDRVTQAANSIKVLFSAKLQRSTGGLGDPFQNFIGPDNAMGYPIIRKTDLESSAGQVVHFTKNGALMGAGKRGSTTLRGTEEKMRYGTDSVKIDFVRHATGWTRKDLMVAAAGRELPVAAAEELGMWLGQTRTQFILQRLRGRAQPGVNVFYPNARGSIANLTSSDTVSTSVMERSAALLGQVLAKPIGQKKMPNTGAMIANYLFFGPDTVLQPLFSDSAYNNASFYSDPRGEGNSIRYGGFANWRGHGVFHWYAGDEDGNGPIGSFFNPKFLNGTAIAAGTAALVLTGGGALFDAAVDYFRFFPGNSSYIQYQGETITEPLLPNLVGEDYFIKIFNHVESTTGAADQGKWGLYRYLGNANTGLAITTAAYSATTGRGGGRLSATGNGGGGDTRHTTVGTVTFSSLVNTEAHPVGAPAYLANKAGQVIGFLGALGSNAVMIAYGGGAGANKGASINGTKYDESDDYAMQVAAGIEAVKGVDVRLDTQGRPRGYVFIPVVYTPVEV